MRLAMRGLERKARRQTERHTGRSPNPAVHRYRVVQIRPEATTFKSNSNGEAKEKQILWSKAAAPQRCPSRLLQKQMLNLQPCIEGSKVLSAHFFSECLSCFACDSLMNIIKLGHIAICNLRPLRLRLLRLFPSDDEKCCTAIATGRPHALRSIHHACNFKSKLSSPSLKECYHPPTPHLTKRVTLAKTRSKNRANALSSQHKSFLPGDIGHKSETATEGEFAILIYVHW